MPLMIHFLANSSSGNETKNCLHFSVAQLHARPRYPKPSETYVLFFLVWSDDNYVLYSGIDLTKRKSGMHFFEMQVETKKN